MTKQDPQEHNGEPEAAAAELSAGRDDEHARLTTRCRELEAILRSILDHVPLVAWRVDRDGTIQFADGRGLANAGITKEDLLGRNAFEIYADDVTGAIRAALTGQITHAQSEGYGISWENWDVPMRNDAGEITGVLAVSLDVTENRRVERELRNQLDVVMRQRQVIQDLSTPILQIWEGVIALPMIGVIDSMRTAEVMDSLLDAVVRDRARFALLDLTGVEAVDTKTASYLIDLVRAIRLLGAEGVITGIRPSVAQTVVALGVDLSEITTLGNLRAGLRHCIVQMRREQVEAKQEPRKPSP